MLASDKVLLCIGNQLALSTMNALFQQQRLAGILVYQTQQEFTLQLVQWCQNVGLTCVVTDGTLSETQLQSVRAMEAYMGFAFGFNPEWLSSLQSHVTDEVYRVDCASLENYQSTLTPYWMIADQVTHCQVVLIRERNKKEEFCVLLQQAISQQDTLGFIENRLYGQVDQLIYGHILNLEKHIAPQWRLAPDVFKQYDQNAKPNLYVNWKTHSAADISALARAGNPGLGGCVVILNKIQLALLEATPCEFDTWEVEPGTICHSGDPHGLIVATYDGALRLNVISSADGVYSARCFSKAFLVEAGMRFESPASVK